MPVSALIAANTDGEDVTVDGRMLKSSSATVFEAGMATPVPLLIGSDAGEDSLMGQGDPQSVLSGYTAQQLTALRAAYGSADDAALAHAIFRDSWMGAPARWIAAHQSAKAPTYLYQFGYIATLRRWRHATADHGSEIPFVFGNPPVPWLALLDGGAETATMHGCWVAFVKTGRPTCPGAPPWPTYAATSDQLMWFGPDKTKVVTGFHKASDDILDGIETAGLAKPTPQNWCCSSLASKR